MSRKNKLLQDLSEKLQVRWQPGESVVALSEEYGFHYWFWFTGLPGDELEKWWSNLHSVSPYFMNPLVPDDGAVPLPGKLILCSSLEDLNNDWNLFDAIADYSAHIHDDGDSYLRKTVYIRHLGYEESG